MQLPDQPASWQSLYSTRNQLAQDYFFTSDAWQYAHSLNPSLPSSDQVQSGQLYYEIAKGSLPSMVLSGTIRYIEDRREAAPSMPSITVTAEGLNHGSIVYPGGISVPMNFAGFDVRTNAINGVDITSPSLGEYDRYFTVVSEGDSRGVLDFLMQGLLRGPVVFGMYYTDSPDGHAVLATDIQIDDINSNGVIERGEAQISFIDPLNPSDAYSPPVGALSTEDLFGRIESVGSPKFTTADLWQDPTGYLNISYPQRSLVLEDTTNTIKLSNGKFLLADLVIQKNQ
jgi:hypothetical protein